jgi:hypothetical protein
VINYINKIATLIYGKLDAKALKISLLLHTLTFKIKGKRIPVKKNWIF